MFSLYIRELADVPPETWVELLPLFEQAIDYPPPDSHPLKATGDIYAGATTFRTS